MSESDQIINEFLQDAAPGEIKDVINDLNVILNDSSVLQSIKASLQSAVSSENGSSSSSSDNAENFQLISLPNADKLSIISKYNARGSKFYDSQLDKLFNVKFLENEAIDVEDSGSGSGGDGGSDGASEEEKEFGKLTKSLQNYVAEHYPIDASQKKLAYDIIQPDENKDEFIITFINTKYNPSNFINGKWLSHYKYNQADGTLAGNVHVDIHYYEDGNVRLKTSKKVEETGVGSLEELIVAIKQNEEQFEKLLNKKFLKLNEVDFKSLRRQLPVTRSKINWGKAIGNYRLGRDVNNQS